MGSTFVPSRGSGQSSNVRGFILIGKETGGMIVAGSLVETDVKRLTGIAISIIDVPTAVGGIMVILTVTAG